jgi:hypothetical protein
MLIPVLQTWQIIVRKIYPVLLWTVVNSWRNSHFTYLLLESEGEQSPMHPQASLVVDESPFSKAVHEEADSGARRTDHLR